MKFTLFNLMPYRALDFAALGKYRSSWVYLPNSYYDPEKGADDYEAYIDQLIYGEQLGFDILAVNEHHQTAYGLMPAPNLIASILCDRTKSAKIAVLGRALPLVANPLSIAEEFAMLDVLSRGRIIAGFVRGLGSEYHASGTNPYFSHSRFLEAHELIISAWSKPSPFAFDGNHFNYQHVNIWPRPFQNPHPPVWIPSQGSQATIEWASHPERRYPFLVTFSPRTAVTHYLGLYRESARRMGYQISPEQLGWSVPIYVADTDEKARAEAREPLERLVNDYFAMPIEMLLPPGYAPPEALKMAAKARSAVLGKRLALEDMLAVGNVIVGSANTVREELMKMRDATGLGTLVAVLQFGNLSNELTRRNMEMFSTEVMPRLRD